MQRPFRYTQRQRQALMRRHACAYAVSAAVVAMVAAGGRLPLAFEPAPSAQSIALKEIVPAGWLIGAAINQNQSDGRDTVAVD